MRLVNGTMKLDEAILKNIFLEKLDNIYCIKKHLLKIIPQLALKASFEDLKKAMVVNVDLMKVQVLRMDVIYNILKAKHNPGNCTFVKTLSLDLSNTLLLNNGQYVQSDLALLIHLQIIESIEIAYFEVLKNISAAISNPEIETMLKQNFETSINGKKLYELIANEYLI